MWIVFCLRKENIIQLVIGNCIPDNLNYVNRVMYAETRSFKPSVSEAP